VYSLKLFSNTSENAAIAQPFLKHGTIRAVQRFRLTDSPHCLTAPPMAALAATEKQLSELQAQRGPVTAEHQEKIEAAQEKVKEAKKALSEAQAAVEEASAYYGDAMYSYRFGKYDADADGMWSSAEFAAYTEVYGESDTFSVVSGGDRSISEAKYTSYAKGVARDEDTLTTVISQDCLPVDSGWFQDGQGLVCPKGAFSVAPTHLEMFSLTLLPAGFNYSMSQVLGDQAHFPGAHSTPQNSTTRGTWSPCQLCPPGSFSDRPGSRVCWYCPDPEVAPVHGSFHCQNLPQYSGSVNPQNCPSGVADCIAGEACWPCLSRCCDPCREFLRRPQNMKVSGFECGFDTNVVHKGTYQPAALQLPRPIMDELTTPPPTMKTRAATTTVATKTTTTTTPSPVGTTPIRKECGNARRFQLQSKCFTSAFGGTLVMPCDHLEQETEDGWVLLGSDGRWHLTEECDDGNVFNGDGCSSECTVEEGFACTSSSHESRSAAGETGDEQHVPAPRALRGDFCMPVQPRGLMALLATKGSLEGWATVAHVGGREDAGWMKFSLQPYLDGGVQPITTRWGSVFLKETGSVDRANEQRHELWDCACDSEFKIFASWNGSYSTLRGSVSHDRFTCSFRIDPPGALSVKILLDLSLLPGEEIEVWDAEWTSKCKPCKFDGSLHAGKNSIIVATPATLHIIADGTRHMQDFSYLKFRAKISFQASKDVAPFQVTFGLRKQHSGVDFENHDRTGILPSMATRARDRRWDHQRSEHATEILRVAIGAQGAGENACDLKPYNSIRPSNYLKMRRSLGVSSFSPARTWNIDGAWEGETRAEVIRKHIGGVENGRCGVKLVIAVPSVRLHVYGCRQENSKDDVLIGAGGNVIEFYLPFHI
jgi:cysteine-rich repeat protein